MDSINDKESCNKLHKGKSVSYQSNDDEIRTGTIISIGIRIKIKEHLTKIINFASINKVRPFRFQFRLRYE